MSEETLADAELRHEATLRQRTMVKVGGRLIPFLLLMFAANFLDRVNISFAALQMNQDLHLTPKVYAFAAGILFVAYTSLEVPSNLILHRVGARIWLSRIMITWGLLAAANCLVYNKNSLYVARLLLGAAEAGFFPGIMVYLCQWFPSRERATAITLFMIGNPIAIIFGAPISTSLLTLGNMIGIAAWRWLFILEGIPAALLGVAALWWLTDTPDQAEWLEPEERVWLSATIREEMEQKSKTAPSSAGAVFLHGPTWALALSKFCVLVAFYGIAFWMPQIVKAMGHLSLLKTGFITAIPYIFAVIGSALVGRHSDRTGERRWHIAIPAFIGLLGFLVTAKAGNPIVGMAGLTLAATCIWCSNTIFWTVPASLLTGASAAGGLALINSVGSLGGFFGPYLTGWVLSSTGKYSHAMVLLGISLVLSGVILLLVKLPKEQRPIAAA
jgi:ACS family tartrate transporter-like MFS transporter